MFYERIIVIKYDVALINTYSKNHKSKLNFLIFPFVSYLLSSGYKPAPMDLSCIKLTPSQEAMVDKLAENAHNVWARDRIRQGWTYGIQQVSPEMDI